jgi:hypothetical protein
MAGLSFSRVCRTTTQNLSNHLRVPAPKGSLRYIARQLLNRAGEETAAAREIGDRLDGRPAQAIVGDDQFDAIRHVHEVRRTIVRSENG